LAAACSRAAAPANAKPGRCQTRIGVLVGFWGRSRAASAVRFQYNPMGYTETEPGRLSLKRQKVGCRWLGAGENVADQHRCKRFRWRRLWRRRIQDWLSAAVPYIAILGREQSAGVGARRPKPVRPARANAFGPRRRSDSVLDRCGSMPAIIQIGPAPAASRRDHQATPVLINHVVQAAVTARCLWFVFDARRDGGRMPRSGNQRACLRARVGGLPTLWGACDKQPCVFLYPGFGWRRFVIGWR
jgi:hypothetical protein